MVSKAREDLPDPDRPVRTVNVSRGISTSTFLRLCSRAPRMEIFFSISSIFSLSGGRFGARHVGRGAPGSAARGQREEVSTTPHIGNKSGSARWNTAGTCMGRTWRDVGQREGRMIGHCWGLTRIIVEHNRNTG